MAEMDDFIKYPNPIAFNKLEESNKSTSIKMSHSMSQMKQGATLSFHDINYTLEMRKCMCCGPKETKHILKDVNGICRPGMNAILGPTGSGKTSLLDVLAGRKDPCGLTGQLLMDGNPIPQNFKCMVGYVMQEDTMMGTLSVRENMMFSANLRLPQSYTSAARAERVDELIQELGLFSCRNTKVGNEFIRGVSGGEKKRTNIGMELVTIPPLLFLDEPTTGLDSSTAYSVMMMLRRLALNGRTIIFSIHQPRFAIFKLFDDLTLLSKGQLVYKGPSQHTIEYFKEMGYVCEEHNNPSDFFLDVINGDVAISQHDQHNDDITNEQMPKSEESISNLQKSFVQNYEKSAWSTRLLEDLKQVNTECLARKKIDTDKVVKRVNYKSSVIRQFGIVSARSLKNILRSPQTTFIQGFVVIILALLVGAIFYQLDEDTESAIQNRRGAMFFVVMNQIFSNLSALEIFIRDRALFIHENSSGYYRVSSYYLAKLLCDLLPMRLFPAIAFSAISYWMIGFRPEVGAFFTYMFLIFLTTMAACGIAFLVSSSVRIFAIANLLSALIFVLMMVFGGLLIQIDALDDWIRWLKWFSIFRYSLEGLSIIEFRDRDFCFHMKDNTTRCTSGSQFLTLQGIDSATEWDLWSRHLALAGIIVVCLLLTYIQLLRVKKLK